MLAKLEWTLGWSLIAVGVTLAINVIVASSVNKTKRAWWTDRSNDSASGWPPRKRTAAVLLVGVNLLGVLVVVGRLLNASSAITAVTGALGAAALTQWNQRGQSDREAADRKDERNTADRRREEDRDEAAQRRQEDRAEAAAIREEARQERREEWVRERRFKAYESLVSAAADLTQAGVMSEGVFEATARVQLAYSQVEIWGTQAGCDAARDIIISTPDIDLSRAYDESKWTAFRVAHAGLIGQVWREVGELETP